MSERTVSLIATAALALLLHTTARSADAAPATAPSAQSTPQPAVTSPVAPTPSAAAAPDAAASAPPGTKDSATAAAAPAAAPASLDSRIQELKGDVIRLNRDLLVLEEELLYPANTQVAVFVSMDVGKMFDLDSVQIKLDDKVVTNYLYTPLEVQALHRGGVQRAYLGNLKAGTHEIVAFFTGGGPHDRDYKRGTTIKFDKGTDPKYIELRIKDSTGKLQPEFDVKVWQ
ncbi:MAG TPA: AraC family transcriptional regulator [Burkholderiaceae bacterium]|nr:AraC family transcriptional regulator [Burkholderiaceae bacterium]